MQTKPIFSLTIISALFLTACGSGSVEANSGTSPAPKSLPFAEIIASETKFGNFQDIADQTDAVFHGELVGIVENWQKIEQQEGETGDEYVGLRFNVKDLISGKLETEEVTVGFLAYAFDHTTKERINKISTNGLDISDFKTGQEYVLTVGRDSRLENNYGIGWTSTIQSIDQDGTLVALSDEDGYKALGIDTIEDLQTIDIEEKPKPGSQPNLNDPQPTR